MPGNLVSHRLPNLRTRGSVQSAFLFCCRLLLCVSMAGCSIVGSSPADWGTITQVYLNNLSTVGTLQLNDARSGSHFIKMRQSHFGQRFTTLISYELGFIVYGPPHPFRLEPNYKGRKDHFFSEDQAASFEWTALF